MLRPRPARAPTALALVFTAALVVVGLRSSGGKETAAAQKELGAPSSPAATGAVDAGARDVLAAVSRSLGARERAFLASQAVDARGRARQRSGGQFSLADRELALAVLGSGDRKRVLCFGIPPDAAWWAAHHEVVALSDDREAVAAARAVGVGAYEVAYHSAPQRDFSTNPFPDTPARRRRLRIESSQYSFARGADEPWDVVVVDGPLASNDAAPGRAAPIHYAARLLRHQRRVHPGRVLDVLVHDAHRPADRDLAMAYLASTTRFVNYEALAKSNLANAGAVANASSVPVVEFAWFR